MPVLPIWWCSVVEFGCSCKNICSSYGIVTTGCDVRCVLHYRAATATQSDAPSQCLPRYVRCTRADGGCREFVVWPQWKDVACKVKPNTNRSRRDTTNILSGTSLIRRRYACFSSNLLSLEKLRWVCDLANLMDNNIEWLLISVWQQLASTHFATSFNYLYDIVWLKIHNRYSHNKQLMII